MPGKSYGYLKRLPPEYYRGRTCVHWSMTIQDRQTGWLIPAFYLIFRELLAHTAFRYSICSPIFCLMPDHIHLLCLGLNDSADQRLALQFLRKQLNSVLASSDRRLQKQGYDHVLREDERQPTTFQNIVEYIARNPERKQLVPLDRFQDYPFTGCLIPGYPELSPFQQDFWPLFDRLYAKLAQSQKP